MKSVQINRKLIYQRTQRTRKRCESVFAVGNNFNWQNVQKFAAASVVGFGLIAGSAAARFEEVNKPELLPKEQVNVIDVAGFLTDGEEKRLQKEIQNLENDTGVKLRVLAQNYPYTPGLAIREYWQVDDDTVVFVADPTFGDILNFNVGQNIDLQIPRSFWSRLAGKYGNKFYWQEKGQESSIVNAVSAIDTCVREPPGRLKCSQVQGEFGEEPSSGPIGRKLFGT
eukprot:TRINITY_DN37860_c1_g1_i3.p1 TRINITY_DN37860_c1_g1~~TRINITY_DN37860_c1_g1_i3.p1  ORF type:complete len:226 (+),score=36.41 TRINITY_DN37860_c1_g1_i3:124-801(+)